MHSACLQVSNAALERCDYCLCTIVDLRQWTHEKEFVKERFPWRNQRLRFSLLASFSPYVHQLNLDNQQFFVSNLKLVFELEYYEGIRQKTYSQVRFKCS
jgi:hypothetical protein